MEKFKRIEIGSPLPDKIDTEWILITNKVLDIDNTIYDNIPSDPNVGACYFDEIDRSQNIYHHQYMHLLLSNPIETKHLLIRSEFADLIKSNIFETILAIYNRSIVRHIPISIVSI